MGLTSPIHFRILYTLYSEKEVIKMISLGAAFIGFWLACFIMDWILERFM